MPSLRFFIEPVAWDSFNAKALHVIGTQRATDWGACLGAILCSLLLIGLGVLGSNPAWHEALHQEVHEAAAGIHDGALPGAADNESSHPEDTCAVCAYLHQQVGGVVESPSVVVVLETAGLRSFAPPAEPVLVALRHEPRSRGPPFEI
jgi:hypothetical protein